MHVGALCASSFCPLLRGATGRENDGCLLGAWAKGAAPGCIPGLSFGSWWRLKQQLLLELCFFAALCWRRGLASALRASARYRSSQRCYFGPSSPSDRASDPALGAAAFHPPALCGSGPGRLDSRAIAVLCAATDGSHCWCADGRGWAAA